MSDRTVFPNSYAGADGIVHAGEKCIRHDGESDWPWFDCGRCSSYARWVARAPNCLWCAAEKQAESHVIAPTSTSTGSTWRGVGPWVGSKP